MQLSSIYGRSKKNLVETKKRILVEWYTKSSLLIVLCLPLVYNFWLELWIDLRRSRMCADKMRSPCSSFRVFYFGCRTAMARSVLQFISYSKKALAGETELKTTHNSVAKELKKNVPWFCHISSRCPLEVIFMQCMWCFLHFVPVVEFCWLNQSSLLQCVSWLWRNFITHSNEFSLMF